MGGTVACFEKDTDGNTKKSKGADAMQLPCLFRLRPIIARDFGDYKVPDQHR